MGLGILVGARSASAAAAAASASACACAAAAALAALEFLGPPFLEATILGTVGFGIFEGSETISGITGTGIRPGSETRFGIVGLGILVGSLRGLPVGSPVAKPNEGLWVPANPLRAGMD